MFKINLSKEPIVLIDCSYYIFYRYNATEKWMSYKLQRKPILKTIGDINLLDNTDINPSTSNIDDHDGYEDDDSREFLISFQKHFHKDLQKIKKAFSDNIFMCVDCLRDDIWRKKLFPEYKNNRKRKDDFNRDIFDQFKNNINKTITQISHSSLESDDIVAIIHKTIRSKSKDTPIVIITNDNDYLQLSDSNTRIVSMSTDTKTNKKFGDIRSKCKDPIETQLIRKIVKGDQSDNIRKIGIPKLTKEIVDYIVDMTEDERILYMKKNNTLDKYLFNKRLISFDEIPSHLVEELRSRLILC